MASRSGKLRRTDRTTVRSHSKRTRPPVQLECYGSWIMKDWSLLPAFDTASHRPSRRGLRSKRVRSVSTGRSHNRKPNADTLPNGFEPSSTVLANRFVSRWRNDKEKSKVYRRGKGYRFQSQERDGGAAISGVSPQRNIWRRRIPSATPFEESILSRAIGH
jgi:hypothetical protein